MITRENYEIYFMEYMDGNLSAREQAEVEAFLLVHPDLRELLDGMDEVRLEVPAEVFGKKEEIKRTVWEREIEYYAIAAAEGVITDEEQAWVDGNVNKDVFEREVETCAKIKVKPDPTCRFEGKAGVYRKSGAVLFVKLLRGYRCGSGLGDRGGYLFHEKRRIFHGGFTRDCG